MLFRMIYDDKLAQAAYLIGCQRTSEARELAERTGAHRYLSGEGGPEWQYCQSGVRSAVATALLKRSGYKPIDVAGGYARIADVGVSDGAHA